ncbi:MAG: hypothetical protein P8P30_02090 [Rickettsiales bacterium]|nr:hypothetical protein [Rickettsiales bacterium]
MRFVCFLIIVTLLSSYSAASLHAAEFGFDDHEHHEVECQIDDYFFQPISDAVSTPDIVLQHNASWVELTSYHDALMPSIRSIYTPRAPPHSI